MDINIIKNQMDKAIQHLEQEFSHLQLWRANTWLVEWIDVYIPDWDMKQKINQLANITLIDSQTLKIEPWDKWTWSKIEKAIYESWLWLSPINEWSYLLIKIPPLTKERRRDLTKLVSKMWEESKVAIRNIRHEWIKEIKKEFDDKIISEDQKKNYEKNLDDIIKEYSNKIDNEVKNKSEEIMKI